MSNLQVQIGPKALPTPSRVALAEHADDVTSLAFSPDGQWLASGSEDRTVKLWRLEIYSQKERSRQPNAAGST